jgi:hypothetical protein
MTGRCSTSASLLLAVAEDSIQKLAVLMQRPHSCLSIHLSPLPELQQANTKLAVAGLNATGCYAGGCHSRD